MRWLSFIILTRLPNMGVAGCLIAALIAAGCASKSSSTAKYETLAKIPQRNDEIAKKLNETAIEHMHKDEWDAAEKALREALSADIMYGPAHNNLGKVYFQQKKLYLAAWEFQYAMKLMPNQPEPHNNLGLVFESAGKLDEAVSSYAKAMELEPDNPQFLGNSARARVRRGEDSPEVRQLLSRLIIHDTRPEWVRWARQRLALAPRREEP